MYNSIAIIQVVSSNGNEIVIQTERTELEPNLLVAAADEAAQRIVQAGGSVLAEPFDIQIGRCAVVQDPWGNRLVLLDTSKGAPSMEGQWLCILTLKFSPRAARSSRNLM